MKRKQSSLNYCGSTLAKVGKSFTITNRGEAIGDLVPSASVRAKDTVAAAEKSKAFMLADPVHGMNIKKLIEEGSA